jgi:parallel beta-helix repeat protein
MCQVFVIGSGAHASLSDLTIAGGKGTYGGGIYNGGTLELANCTLSGNSAYNGGGIFNGGGATATLANCTLSGNSATDGGGVYIGPGTISPGAYIGTATLANCTLSGNSASNDGGGICIDGGATATLANCTLSDNSASSGVFPVPEGGGIYNAGTLTVSTSTLSGNSAYDGGGVYIGPGTISGGAYIGTATLANCTLSGNSATVGGGIFIYGGATATLANCTLSGNSAAYDGGGIDNVYGTATLDNCTLSGNSASSNGGGIYNAYDTPAPPGTMILNNSIVANSPKGGDIYNDGTLRGSHNLIETPVTGSGTNSLPGWLSGDPRLGPLQDNGGPTQTMALLPGSAAIDAGDNSLVPTGVTTDQRGRDRFVNGITDLGAFEFSPQTAPVTTAVSSGQAYADQHAGWNNTDVSITLAATDPGGSGVARTEYTLDGGADWITYAAPFTLRDEGTYVIGYRSVDLGGNVEATHSLTVKIDKTAPRVSAQPTFGPAGTGWYNLATGAPVIHFTATDGGSGVDYSTVPADQTLGEGANVGTSVTIYDVAGNSAVASISGLKVDLTPPQTAIAVSGKSGPNGWYISAVSVSLSAADKFSGLGATYYTVDGGPQHKYAGAFVIAADGIHIVNYWSSDNAGNVEQRRSLHIQINHATTGTVIGSGSSIYRRFLNIRVHSQMVAGLPVLSGHLSFFDIQTGIYLASTSITYLRVQPDGMHATICGTATVNGFSGFIFTVFVKGNVQPGPGRYDQFRIVISGSAPPGFSYDSNLFNLETGNIQVHKT